MTTVRRRVVETNRFAEPECSREVVDERPQTRRDGGMINCIGFALEVMTETGDTLERVA
jgi:hypothetical protein